MHGRGGMELTTSPARRGECKHSGEKSPSTSSGQARREVGRDEERGQKADDGGQRIDCGLRISKLWYCYLHDLLSVMSFQLRADLTTSTNFLIL